MVFSWSFTLQQFIHIFVFLYHIISVQFAFAYYSTRTSCPSLPYCIFSSAHVLLVTVIARCPVSILQHLIFDLSLQTLFLDVRKSSWYSGIFYVLSNGHAVFWIKPLWEVSSVKDFKGWMFQCMHLYPTIKIPPEITAETVYLCK